MDQTGTDAGIRSVCHNRRSYYRHRGVRNHVRKQRRRGQQPEQAPSEPEVSTSVRVTTLKILAPAVPAAVVHWYRITKDSPLHALGAELWMGNDRVAKIEPVHCLGLTELQVKTLLVRILDVFSQHSRIKVERDSVPQWNCIPTTAQFDRAPSIRRSSCNGNPTVRDLTCGNLWRRHLGFRKQRICDRSVMLWSTPCLDQSLAEQLTSCRGCVGAALGGSCCTGKSL